LQHQNHAVERRCVGEDTLIGFSASQWMRIAGEGGAAGVVYGLQDSRLRRRQEGLCRDKAVSYEQESRGSQQLP
jgi:hypothetical protein